MPEKNLRSPAFLADSERQWGQQLTGAVIVCCPEKVFIEFSQSYGAQPPALLGVILAMTLSYHTFRTSGGRKGVSGSVTVAYGLYNGLPVSVGAS